MGVWGAQPTRWPRNGGFTAPQGGRPLPYGGRDRVGDPGGGEPLPYGGRDRVGVPGGGEPLPYGGRDRVGVPREGEAGSGALVGEGFTPSRVPPHGIHLPAGLGLVNAGCPCPSSAGATLRDSLGGAAPQENRSRERAGGIRRCVRWRYTAPTTSRIHGARGRKDGGLGGAAPQEKKNSPSSAVGDHLQPSALPGLPRGPETAKRQAIPLDKPGTIVPASPNHSRQVSCDSDPGPARAPDGK
jgi:hypothetical protein